MSLGVLKPQRAANLVAPIECRSVPLRGVGRGGIGVLEKLKHRIDRIFRISRIGVVQNELAHLRVEPALARKYGLIETLGHRSRISVECRPAVSAVARPEARADHLMRVGFRLNGVGARSRGRTLAIKSSNS
jgi:hypothetical protein